MRVVLTGGSGLVGQVTLRGLVDAGRDVIVIDRAPLPAELRGVAAYSDVSLDDYPALLEVCRGADAIIHLAAIPHPLDRPPHDIHNNNVTTSYNVLCVAAELGIDRVLMASSVNAIGLAWSRKPVYDYFPVDVDHVTRNEDAYSLSKWIGEAQADSIARMHSGMSIASLRLHMFVSDRAEAHSLTSGIAEPHRGLWGYTTHRMWVAACLLALEADFVGHEVFFVVADRSALEMASAAEARKHYPDVEIRREFHGNGGFFDLRKTERILGWSGSAAFDGPL